MDQNNEVEFLNLRIKALEKYNTSLKKQLTELWARQPERAHRVKRGCLDIIANDCGPCPACGGYNE